MNHRTPFELDTLKAEPSRANGATEATGAGQVADSRTGIVTGSVGPRLLDTHQVAEMLIVGEGWVRDHSRPHGPEPRLPAMKLGTGKTAIVRFHPGDVLAMFWRCSCIHRGAASEWQDTRYSALRLEELNVPKVTDRRKWILLPDGENQTGWLEKSGAKM